ncbi:MAG: 4-hydroxyphenylacetate 3-hydroxylase N-terminal domain-containing protein [Candidatus Binatia bacterium]|nr:4-hydroxyphenylacetate 3-hydroxylase N-terminal domain-containing protein [Candidatus Binatia bacterium]
MKTGDDYRASIRDDRRIFFDGERVDDVTTHPRMKRSVDIIAAGYDQQHALGPDATAPAYEPPRSSDDLRNRLELMIQWDVSLITTLESFNALRTAASRMREKHPHYAERIERYVEYCQAEDIRCVQTISDAKGHRNLPPAQQDDPDVYLRVVEERSDGVVLNGAKLHISGAAITHEMVVMPTKRMKPGEEPWAIACGVPIDAKGITIMNTTVASSGDPRYHPYSQTREQPEGFVVFDHVFVPNERIFLCGEVEFSATFAHALGLWQRVGGAAHMAKNADLLVGLAKLLAEANGLDRVAHIRDKIQEMVIYATLVRAGLEAAITNVSTTPEGWVSPSELYTNAAKYHGAAEFSKMIRHIHDIGGGSIVTAPMPGDLDNPETRPYVEKYMRTMDGIDGEYRTRLFHAIRDITADTFGGWWQVTTMLSGGGLFAQKMVATNHYPMEKAKALARKAGNLEVREPVKKRKKQPEAPPVLKRGSGAG